MFLLDDSSLSPSCPQLPSVVGQPGDTGQAARRGWTAQNQGPAFVGVDVRAWTGLGAAPLAAGTLRPGLGHVHPAALSRARLQLPTPPPPAPRPPHCTASMPQRLTRRADSAAVCLALPAPPHGPARPPASHRRAQPVTRARPRGALHTRPAHWRLWASTRSHREGRAPLLTHRIPCRPSSPGRALTAAPGRRGLRRVSRLSPSPAPSTAPGVRKARRRLWNQAPG